MVVILEQALITPRESLALDRDLTGSVVMKRVLVANGERHIVRLAQVNLERAGCEVLTAFDCEAAFRAAVVEQPDMVLVDAHWTQLAGRLNSDPSTKAIQVVILSADLPFDAGWAV